MTTSCILQASVVSTPLSFPPSIANRSGNLDIHHFSSSKLNCLSSLTPFRGRNYQHLFASSDGNTETCDLIAEAAELNKDKNRIQMFEQRDPGHEISRELHPKTMEANSIFEFPVNSLNLAIMAALTVGVTVLLLDQKAMALGPEGPLMEEFWENMRRYALYALTVSTGVAYAVFQPLYELLRNPISAILVITIAVGSFYLVSQVLSAMVGVSDFNYEYSY